MVLGESPEDMSAAFAHGHAPAPSGGEAFVAPPQLPPGTAAWGGDSVEEEFEAAFAQFEAPPLPPPMQMPQQPAQPHTPTQAAPQNENQGITGDDVVDSIDSFFKLN